MLTADSDRPSSYKSRDSECLVKTDLHVNRTWQFHKHDACFAGYIDAL